MHQRNLTQLLCIEPARLPLAQIQADRQGVQMWVPCTCAFVPSTRNPHLHALYLCVRPIPPPTSTSNPSNSPVIGFVMTTKPMSLVKMSTLLSPGTVRQICGNVMYVPDVIRVRLSPQRRVCAGTLLTLNFLGR